MRTQSIAPDSSNEALLEDLVQRTRNDDEEAWNALWRALAPLIERVAGRFRFGGRLSRCPEARGDVVIRVMEGLRADGCRHLAELGERLARRDGSFLPWLTRVAQNAAVDCVRAHPDYLGRKTRRWVSRASLPGTVLDERPPATRLAEAHRLLERCPEVLDPAQLDALGLWLDDADAAEIAATLHLAGGPREATRLVRSAVARLRRLYAPGAGNAGSKRNSTDAA